MVVIRELFSLVTSAIFCADQRSQVRGYEDCLRGFLKFSSTAAFLPQWIHREHFHFILLCKH